MTEYFSLMRGVSVTVLAALTTGTSNAIVIGQQYKETDVTVIGVGTISTGTLIIEEADDPSYTGTWSQIGSTIDLTALTGGAEQRIHIESRLRALRARIGTNVTGSGGKVTVNFLAGF